MDKISGIKLMGNFYLSIFLVITIVIFIHYKPRIGWRWLEVSEKLNTIAMYL